MPGFLFIGLCLLIVAALLAGAAVIGFLVYVLLVLEADEEEFE